MLKQREMGRSLGTYAVVLCSLGLPEQDSHDLGLDPKLVTLVAISVRLCK